MEDLLDFEEELEEEDELEEEETRPAGPCDSSRDDLLSEWKCSSFEWPSSAGGTTNLAAAKTGCLLTSATQQTGGTTAGASWRT